MAISVFALSLVLLVAGLAAGYTSLDLLPTSVGVLYALGGAVAVCAAMLAFALGALIRRIDALSELVRQLPTGAYGAAEAARVDPSFAAPLADARQLREEVEAQAEEVGESMAEAADEPVAEAEQPINHNRSGHLPTLGEIEHAIETPEAPPSLIGRYSSGGANYMIFADGSIEAETQEGSFKFASMGDFKQYLSERKDGKG
jgi:hypothetical protein